MVDELEIAAIDGTVLARRKLETAPGFPQREIHLELARIRAFAESLNSREFGIAALGQSEGPGLQPAHKTKK
jgi:hypothetical protein